MDTSSESKKLDQLLLGAFPLLRDADLRVIRAFGMEHSMGSETVGNMGYAVIDGRGIVRAIRINPLFGQDAAKIVDMVKSA